MTTRSEFVRRGSEKDVDHLRQVVADAWEATSLVAESVGQETREAAFKLVLEMMLRNGTPHAATDPGTSKIDTGQHDTANPPIDSDLVTEQQRSDALATYLGIQYDEVGDLFDLGESEPRLRVNVAKLASGKAAATREITLLVAASRSALGLDTGSNHVRQAADDLKKLDGPNFVKTLANMPEISLRGLPGSQNRLVRLRGRGVEAARDLAARVVQE